MYIIKGILFRPKLSLNSLYAAVSYIYTLIYVISACYLDVI